MENKNNAIEIPMDVFESEQELVILLPLWWVKKDSIEVYLEKVTLNIAATREKPVTKENLNPLQEECFWWEFRKEIQLPSNIYFDKIMTQLTPENILIITIPKIIIPERVNLEVNMIT